MKKLLFVLFMAVITGVALGSGFGQQIGDFYYYTDNYSGNNYTVQTIGNFDYVNGSNGYHGFGQRIGNFYYYND